MNEQKDSQEISPVKRALLEIRRLREQLERSERRFSEPIAVVGMGCRFPGGIDDPASYWELLRKGGDAISEVPSERWNIESFYDPDPDAAGKMSTRWGGFLRDVDQFDPEFFGISAREAATIDPQQRLLLEVAWETLENAGIAPDSLLGSATGVFAGVGTFDYPQLELQALDMAEIDAYFATGASHSVAAGRISYVLGLKGPCLSVDTACSASLVTVHLACQSLRAGECNLALAGGVGVLLLPEMFVDFSHARMMAADGHCKVFDAAADGYVRSEGCGMVVLKRLRDAVADGDDVVAIIRGSAINHDGRSSGLTAPNGPSQVAVIRHALEQAGLEAADVGYIETHGTGTSLGDPIEVQALAEVFAPGRATDKPLLIGSVKGNLGHLEAAAGIAGLIKVALCLRHRAIPQSLHFETPNPRIAWDRIPVRVAARLLDWDAGDGLRTAGVSSFGFSGTNAHVVLQEAEAITRDEPVVDRPFHILALSARNDAALADSCRRFAAALKDPSGIALPDLAFSANTGRAQFPCRLAVIGDRAETIVAELEAAADGSESKAVVKGIPDSNRSPGFCFLFPGQGSQYLGMGRALYESAPAYRDAMARCDAILEPLLGCSITSVLYDKDTNDRLAAPQFAQPAIVAVEYALAEVWRDWGVTPSAIIGHSLGEYAAAIVSGVLSLEDGLRLVAERARLVEARCPEGRMAAIRADAEAVECLIAELGVAASVAAINASESVVVSGSVAEVEVVVAALEKQGIHVQRLETTRAFHHATLEPALAEFDVFARTLEHRTPEVPLVSIMSGGFFPEDTGPAAGYWAEQARNPVRFHDGLLAAVKRGYDVFLEVGPSTTLTGVARESTGEVDEKRWLSSLRRGRPDWEQILGSLAALYVQGAKIDWQGFDRPYSRHKVAVPTYPFQRKRYWFDQNRTAADRVSADGGHTEPPARPGSLPSGNLDTASWSKIVAAGQRQAAQVPIDLALATYADRWKLLDELTTRYIIRTLRDLGIFCRAGEVLTVDDLVQTAGLLPMYAALVERWLDRLAGRDLLVRRDDGFMAPEALPSLDTQEVESQAQESFADSPYVIDYLKRCGDVLSAVITGSESALETLFPGGSMQTAKDLYRNWPMSRYFNEIVAAVARPVAARVSPKEPVCVLEIGAGTGSTTASVLDVLPPGRTTYWYTDISEYFFPVAAGEFGEYPFLEYGVLDIERNPEEQGYGRGACHAVIAANVLHATRDLGETIDNVRSLLRPGGVLILYEVTDPQSWIDTSIALIAGWAKSSDGLRDNGPLLSAATWRRLLGERGFGDVEVFPQAGSAADVLGLSVIVARAPVSAEAEAVSSISIDRVTAPEATSPAVEEAQAILAKLTEALPNERLDLLVDFVREQVCSVLRRDPTEETVGRRKNLMELGIDSLMAIELRDRLVSRLALAKQLPVSLIFDYPNIEMIARYLAELMTLDLTGDEPPIRDSSTGDNERAQALDGLSDDEVEAMLLKRLQGGGSV